MDSHPGIRMHDDLAIPFEDETIAATRYEPIETDGPLPALCVLTPYRKDDASTFGSGYDAIVSFLALSGYEVVVADLVGTGASTGFKREGYSPDEGAQGAAVVDWLAAREWTTGRIGMFGKSYRGKTAIHTAAEGPDALGAIVPIMGPNSAYAHSRFPGGASSFRHLGGWLARMQTQAALPPSRRDSAGEWADVWNGRLDGMAGASPWGFQQLDHPTFDDHWREKEVDVGDVSVPTFIAAGFRDFLQHDPFAQAEAIPAPTRVLVGPFRHTMPHKGREARVDFRAQVAEWFDHYLTDADNGAPDRPAIAFWTERDGGGVVDGGVWRAAETWPTLPAAEERTLALSPDGLVPEEDFETGEVAIEYEHDHSVGLDSLFYLGQPTDTSADDARSLTAETAPLERAVEWTGTGEATLRLASTVADPLVAVRVVDVSPDGSARLVTYGVLRAALRDDRSRVDELIPGQEYDLTVPLRPRSHVFEPGHRLRLSVSASFFPWVMPAREHGAFTVSSSPESPSLVRFPGRTHDEVAFDDAVEMNPPDETPSPPTGRHVPTNETEIERIRETGSDRAILRTTSESVVEIPSGLLRRASTVEWEIASDDPTTAVARSDWRLALEGQTGTVAAEASNRVGHDAAHLTETVSVDDGVAFDHVWRYERDREE